MVTDIPSYIRKHKQNLTYPEAPLYVPAYPHADAVWRTRTQARRRDAHRTAYQHIYAI